MRWINVLAFALLVSSALADEEENSSSTIKKVMRKRLRRRKLIKKIGLPAQNEENNGDNEEDRAARLVSTAFGLGNVKSGPYEESSYYATPSAVPPPAVPYEVTAADLLALESQDEALDQANPDLSRQYLAYQQQQQQQLQAPSQDLDQG